MSKEYRPQPSKPTEQHKPHQEGANGVPGIQPTLNERAKPPPEKRSRGRPRLSIPPEDTKRLQQREWNDRYYQKHGDKTLASSNSKRYAKDHKEERSQYKRDYRKRRKQEQDAELRQSQQDRDEGASQIFP